MRTLLKSPRTIKAMLFHWHFVHHACLIVLGACVSSVFPEALLQAQPHSHVEVQVRPLTATVMAIPPGRGPSAMRRAADDRWERTQESEAFVNDMRERIRDSENFVVEVKIHNKTDRVYLLKAGKVTLRAESGERVKPLEASEDGPTPVLTDQTIAPGTNVQGYLSFPPGSYTGARGFLIEEQTQANEGFSVDF